MNAKSCPSLSRCVRLLHASGAGGSEGGAWTSLTCFPLLALSASDFAKLDDDRVVTGAICFRGRENPAPSDHQDFQTTNVPAETSSQRGASRELRAIVFVLGYNGFCPDERVHFFWRAAHFFLIKRNWFSDRIYSRVSDKPTDLHTHIQMTKAWCIQRSGSSFETIKLFNIEIADSCRNRGPPPPPYAKCIKGGLG